MSHPSDFFIAGGTLRARAPSYVTRPADQELFEHTLAGEFCYVLTPRQMGKSSLMIRTARQLGEAGRKVAILDLTGIGSGSANEWYLGMLTNISRELRLSADVSSWWQEHAALAIPQRFGEFLREIVLQQVAGPIVIFIDEIDSTLNFDFRDDFFAAIRAIYNARASENAYKRLTFALLGVATPTDLIQDRQRTPFNIGRRIELQEFSFIDTLPLLLGLEAVHPGQGIQILSGIFYWTNGHPYLTQKLCLAAAERPAADWDAAQVDDLVEMTFFSDDGRKDPNFKFVQQRIQESSLAERRQMLMLYRKVYGGKDMLDDDRSQSQNHLELYGLLRVERGKLGVRNDIYRRIFDEQWIEANTPANRDLRWAIGASLIALLAIIVVVIRILQTPSPSTSLYVKQFNDNAFPTARIEALAGLFNLQNGPSDPDDEQGLSLFYNLGPYEQLDLFSQANAHSKAREMTTAIRRISLTLDEQDSNNLAIMGEMITALGATGQPGVDKLINELTNWKKGRELAEKEEYGQAIDAYSMALESINDNPVVYYDRAMAYTSLQQYGKALSDLDQIIRISTTVMPALTPVHTPAPLTPAPATFMLTNTPNPLISSQKPEVTSTSGFFPSVVTASATIATPALTATPIPSVALRLRFVNTERIKATIEDAISRDDGLQSYLQANLAIFPQLVTLYNIAPPGSDEVVHLRVLWVQSLENFYADRLNISGGRIAVVGEGDRGKQPDSNEVFMLDSASGNVLWNFKLTGGGGGAMDVTSAFGGGNVFFGGQHDSKLYALDVETGRVTWERSGVSGLYASQLVVVGDQLFVPDENEGVVMLQASTGKPLWGNSTGAWGLPVAVHNGMVFGVRKKGLIALAVKDGKFIWQFPKSLPDFPWIVAADEQIYLNTSETEVAALNVRDGGVQWRTTLDVQKFGGSGRVGLARNRLYVPIWQDKQGNGSVIAIDTTTGKELWAFSTRAEGVLNVVVANDVVYLTGWASKTVYALASQDGKLLWSSPLENPGGDLVVANGQLFVTSGDRIYAFGN